MAAVRSIKAEHITQGIGSRQIRWGGQWRWRHREQTVKIEQTVEMEAERVEPGHLALTFA
eukprot:scaffold138114_cov19-Tisochrysis_lutea.AAC.1